MSRRKYKTGTGWCFWRWTDVDSEYITRLHIIKTPWFAICLHWLNKPDPEPWNHDHPVTFLSIILRGWYREERKRPGKPLDILMHRWFNFIRATPEDYHTIINMAPRTITLCFMGPKTRDWGFHSDRGWIYWRDYYKEQRLERATKR